jgi:hypothetical protein
VGPFCDPQADMAVLWRFALRAACQELFQILIYGWTGEGRTLLVRLYQLGIPESAVLGDIITEPGVDDPAYHIIGLRKPQFVPHVLAALATLVPTAILRPLADKKYLPLHAFWASTAFVHSYATSRKDAAAKFAAALSQTLGLPTVAVHANERAPSKKPGSDSDEPHVRFKIIFA